MKLELNCVRSVLRTVEALDFSEHSTPEKLHKELPEYSVEQLEYTCLMLGDGGFLTLMTCDVMGSHLPGVKAIVSLTYKGHEFLNSIRDEKQWTAVGKGLRAVRNYSLEAVSMISKGVTEAALAKFLSENLQTGP